MTGIIYYSQKREMEGKKARSKVSSLISLAVRIAMIKKHYYSLYSLYFPDLILFCMIFGFELLPCGYFLILIMFNAYFETNIF